MRSRGFQVLVNSAARMESDTRKGAAGMVVKGSDETKNTVAFLPLSPYGFATSLMAKMQPLLCTGCRREPPL